MKKALLIAFVLASASTAGRADTTLLSQDFSTFTDGALVGQSGWLQTSSVATFPIQVNTGSVILGSAGGQDVYNPFASVVPLSSLSSITVTMDLSIDTAASGGDYFFHLGSTAGSSSGFSDRLWAKSTTGGFLFGVSGTGTVAYGTTALDLGTPYSLTLTWTMVSGASNDTLTLLVDGNSYLSSAFIGGDTEPTAIAEANFRQGSASASPSASVDNLVITSAAAVPEPGTVALIGLGLGVVLFGARRKRA